MVTFFIHAPSNAAENPDSAYVHHLLLRIQQLQSNGEGYFANGLFPSWREYALNKDTYKADDNIFYTGLIVFTLKQCYPYLNKADKTICDSIFQKAEPVFKMFKNKNGRNTYNFWRTDKPFAVPNGGLLKLVDGKNSLPDDADDTVISLLALEADSAAADTIHQLLQASANTKKATIKNTFAEYKDMPAYSTWFGKNWPIDFDVCVLSNILYFVQKHNLAWQKEDSASFQLMQSVLFKNQYNTHAAYVSPHYNRTEVILYHYARLLPVLTPSTQVDSMKNKVKKSLKEKYAQSTSFMDKVMLNTSSMRLNEPAAYLVFPPESDWYNEIENADFVLFIADFMSMLPNGYRQFLGATNLAHFEYHCPAYNLTMVLECLIEQRKLLSTLSK